jgi:N-acetyltransferase
VAWIVSEESLVFEGLVLEGARTQLVPLSLDHAEALIQAASDGELWTLPVTIVPSRGTMHAYIGRALEFRDLGREYPFVIVDRSRRCVVGSTRYMNIDLQNRKREIGYTWLARSAQGTAINTEAKLLLLQHAFEVLRCIRVEFMTDVLNARSRAALLGIGATLEGVARNHMIMPDGRYRDSASYSIIESEWPAVKNALKSKLGIASAIAGA